METLLYPGIRIKEDDLLILKPDGTPPYPTFPPAKPSHHGRILARVVEWQTQGT